MEEYLDYEQVMNLANLIYRANIDWIELNLTQATKLFSLDDTPVNEKNKFSISFRIGIGTARIQINGELIRKLYPKNYFRLLDNDKSINKYSIARMLNYCNKTLTAGSLVNKISEVFSDEFNHLSLGQAKAVIKRHLSISLTQVERNDLYRLRKKMDSYSALIHAFEFTARSSPKTIRSKSVINQLSSNSSKDEVREFTEIPGMNSTDQLSYYSSTEKHYRLFFRCWECNEHYEIEETDQPILVPKHHEILMDLGWNTNPSIKAEDMGKGINELIETITDLKLKRVDKKDLKHRAFEKPYYQGRKGEKIEFKLVCHECEFTIDTSSGLLEKIQNSKYSVELPKHHNKEMRLISTTMVEWNKSHDPW